MAKNPFGSDDARGGIDNGTQPEINPSAPTTGTEGWGNAPDEADVPGANPTAKRPGKEGGGNLRDDEQKKRAS